MEYDPKFLEDINARADLLEYAEEDGVDFIRRGKEWFTHCPRHVDKTPSLSISENDHTSWFCFGCLQGGGLIQWLQHYDDLPLDSAVKKAARIVNMDMDSMCKSDMVHYLRGLKNKQKKCTRQDCSSSHQIISYDEYKKFSIEHIGEWEDEGIPYDILRLFDVRVDHKGNRIVYPVFDNDGNLINIKGRTRYVNYKDMRLMKYMNYYKVGSVDYLQGLNITKPFILEQKEIILFESIKSVMKAFSWGIKNCVSVEGHYLTDEQTKILLGLRCNIVVAFDKDVNLAYNNTKEKKLKDTLHTLSRFTNVFIIQDSKYDPVLGEKDAPCDEGEEVFRLLYENKRRF